MRYLSFPLLTIALGAMACGNAATTTEVADASGRGADRPASPTEAPADAAANAPTQARPQPKTDQYRLLGVLDPDFKNMVAFALKMPRGWQASQSFKRAWDGAVPTPQIYISFRSPDATQRIDYLPSTGYVYSDGPNSQALRAQKQQLGMQDVRISANELAPMPALAYLKKFLLPQLAQQGVQLRNVGNERSTPPHPSKDSPGRTESSASVDGVLANGRKVRVEARLGLSQTPMNGDTFYSWSVVPSLTQTSGDLAATYAHTKAAQESITVNPAWLQKNKELVAKGQQANLEASRRNHEAVMGNIAANTAASTAAHNQRMRDIAAVGAANTARYNDRMNTMDQNMATYKANEARKDGQHEMYVDNVIRNETKYADPGTGERVKLDNRYEHAYTDGKGNYYQSNTPIRASDVNWQELGKVSANDY
ncbi:hypothetical protein [Hymenobacter ruricola]|uniref:Lipoprotein n=1 Tax=Hymenobacter ruricola TaxID=2791023 RepID=A0ABS0I4B3_9BACT|nr:hypothetical protein [Hymenobacter ruricola]MBF9221749.1 hypothetical protein [Hymenobacter ruricola]